MPSHRSSVCVALFVGVCVCGAGCAPPAPEEEAVGPLISLFDLDDDRAVCVGDEVGFASASCAVDVDAAAAQAFVVENRGDEDLALSAVFAGDVGGFFLDAAPDVIAPGDRGEVVVSLVGVVGLVGHGEDGVLRLDSNASNAPIVDVALRAAGCAAAISVSPAACDFGEVDVDGVADSDLSINNPDPCELLVRDLSFSPETPGSVFAPTGAFPTPFVVPGGGGVSLRLQARPREATVSTGALIVESNAALSPQLRVPLQVSGRAP